MKTVTVQEGERPVYLRYHAAHTGMDSLVHTVLQYRGSYADGAFVVPDWTNSRQTICGWPFGGVLTTVHESWERCPLCFAVMCAYPASEV